MKKTKRLVLLAMLTAVAMILSYVESLLPQIGIPGVKMGLANIAVIFALFRFGWKEAAALSLVRVVLVSLLFGSVGAMLYSLAGAVLSLAVMALLRRIDRFSTVGISVAGGVAHNAGQILMAMLILQTKQLLVYLPVLAVSGIAGGVLHLISWIALLWKKERNVLGNLVLLLIFLMSFNTQNLVADVFFWLFPVMALTERGLPLFRKKEA